MTSSHSTDDKMLFSEFLFRRAQIYSELDFDKISQNLNEIKYGMDHNFKDFMVDEHRTFKNSLTSFTQHAMTLRKDYNEIIVNSLEESYKNYVKEYLKKDPFDFSTNFRTKEDMLSNRLYNIDDNFVSAIKKRITKYSNWMYPGMILCPSDSRITKNFVAFDPMYLVDFWPEIPEKHIKSFGQVFKDKIPQYKIDYYNHNMNHLPQNQFGFVMCLNTFPFMPPHTIENYLRNILKVLRPGGVLLMNYANCDEYDICQLYDIQTNFVSYNSKPIMEEMYTTLGYEHVYDFRLLPHHQFLEIKKPGTIQSIKTKPPITMAKNDF